MFIRLTAIFLLGVNYSFAQIDALRSPTKFDKFITLSKVTWAAYVNDTIWYDKYDLTDILLKRFQQNEIKISYPISRDSLMAGYKIPYMNKKGLEQITYAPGYADNPPYRLDNNSSLINIAQILYVANGKLYSYIPWVSPKISVYTSRNNFIGTAEYFSSGINAKYNFSPSKRDKLVFIRSTKRKIPVDNIPRTNLLKQLYGINLLEAIWNNLLHERNEVTDIRNGQNIVLKNLKEFTFTNTVSIPVYDSLGNITGTKTYSEPLTPSLFPQIEITQNWFYDHTKNVVVNNIMDITLFLKNKGLSEEQELIPAFKITFK